MKKSATAILPAPGFWKRLASMLYESLLLAALLFIAALIFVVIIRDPLVPTIKPLFQGYLLAVMAGYFTWFWLHGGQTLAMKTWRIKVASEDGGPINPRQAMLRFLVAAVTIPLGGIGIFWALIDRERQFLYDRVAGTRLVTKDK